MSKSEKEDLLELIDRALDDVRPHLIVDGGTVEVMDLTEDMCVKVKWIGSCELCSMAAMTMKAGIEQTLKSRIPQISSVEAINGIQL